MKITSQCRLGVLASLLLTGCSSTQEGDSGRPLSAAELEYQRRLEMLEREPKGPQEGRTGAELMVRLDQNLQLWHRSNIEQVGTRDRELVDNIEDVLQRTVYLNFETVLAKLETGEPHQRGIAAAALGFSRLKEPADPGERDRFLARWPQIYPRAIEPLIRFLDDEETFVVQNCLLGLWKLGDPNTPIQPVLRQLNRSEEDVRSTAVLALSTILTPETGEVAISALINMLYDPKPKVRNHAVSAVAAIRHRSATGRLAQLLDDPYLLVQANAARALGELGDIESCEFLLVRLEKLLKDKPSGEFRRRTDLDNRRDLVYQHLMGSLQKLSGQELGDDVEEWREWWTENRSRS